MLLHGTPVKLVGFKHSKAPRVDVTIRDVYRTEDRIFIRYTIENHTGTPYQPSTPRVVSLKSRAATAPTSLTNSQLGDEYLRLRSDGTNRVVRAPQSPEGIRPGIPMLEWLQFNFSNSTMRSGTACRQFCESCSRLMVRAR
jgi:hypothetical protein